MFARCVTLISVLLLSIASTAVAQFKDEDPEGAKMGNAKVQKWQCGVIITATGGPCKNITGYAPIPIEWPEQQVSIVKEDVSPGVKIGYESREGTAKVMTIRIPQLAAGQEAKAVVTLEIRRNAILPPEKTDEFVLPDPKKLPADIRRYLTPSPLIESTDPKIKALSKEIAADAKNGKSEKDDAKEDNTKKTIPLSGQVKTGIPLLGDAKKDETKKDAVKNDDLKKDETKTDDAKTDDAKKDGDELNAWDRVEAYYDWVRKHVKYQAGPIKGALAGLRDGTGDCEELTSLFIALCRAADIPARTVWVQGHCYPEFYLQDKSGNGHWFPCQAAGSREFGGIAETRPILQKGDNFKPHPGQKKHQRYLAEFLTGTPVGNATKPSIKPIRQLLP